MADNPLIYANEPRIKILLRLLRAVAYEGIDARLFQRVSAAIENFKSDKAVRTAAESEMIECLQELQRLLIAFVGREPSEQDRTTASVMHDHLREGQGATICVFEDPSSGKRFTTTVSGPFIGPSEAAKQRIAKLCNVNASSLREISTINADEVYVEELRPARRSHDVKR